jgi:sarcosine oxidase subunit alpha
MRPGEPLRFRFDGVELEGRRGDTLAAALLANGIDVVAHSIHRGRPRGIVAAGDEEPNALVQVELPGGSEPMLRATEVELFDGLVAEGLDGRGRLSLEPDAARHDHMYAHCDVLVVGAGPAGLAAADAAARTAARLILVDAQPQPGGSLLASREELDGAPAGEWVAGVLERLDAAPETQVLTRATAIGYYDANYVVIAERRTDHLGAAAPPISRQRLWHVRARRVVLATGAHERPLVFAGNDRPGVMLAGAVRTYANRWGVIAGRTAVVFTTNDSAYAAACDLADAGVEIAAIVDARHDPAGAHVATARERGIAVLDGRAVVATTGERRLDAADVMALTDAGVVGGEPVRIPCDLLAVSGGWNPAVHLFSQSRGRLRYDPQRVCFVPDEAAQAQRSAGACAGTFALDSCLAEGAAAGAEAAWLAGFGSGEPPPAPAAATVAEQPPRALWLVPPVGDGGWDEHFVDLQRDATVADVRRAAGAGLHAPEHVKRYTTIGTANDQGRTAGVSTLGVLAHTLGVDIAELGPTTFRPPYAPVPFALLAGRNRGELHDPIRVTPIHAWHERHGARFEDVGQWKRPWYYPRDGEAMDAAVLRECAAARTGVAVMDASTLGKIDVQGPDAVTLLNRLYTGDFSTLAPGRCKYGVLCGPDGMVIDDGVSMRLADDHFIVTTTTGNAAAVLDWFEEWLQTEWPDLRARCTSVTEQWATVAVVGPRSRDVLRALGNDIDVAQEAFPWMAIREGMVAGIPARVCRISFSGELAFEINVAGTDGLALWEAVMAAGERWGITPYGTETMHVLRAEKGYAIVGQDTDGTVTPQDLGLSWLVSTKKGDFVGRRSHRRPDALRPDRKHLVGLLTVDPDERLPEGAQLVTDPDAGVPVPMDGHVTSSYRSAALGRTFALALLKRGRERIGETVYAPLGTHTAPALVTEPVFYDPEGTRRDG